MARTDNLAALRVLLAKYSDDQPRDEAGRWTAGGGTMVAGEDRSDDEAILALGDSPVRWAARDWSGGGFASHNHIEVRDALARGRDLRPGDGSFEHGRILLEAANAAKPTTYPLYRGFPVTEGAWNQLRAEMQPGARVDLNLASWTGDARIAGDFARDEYRTADGAAISQDANGSEFAPRQVVLTLDAGAHAYDATNDIVQGPQFAEHLTAGTFEVEAASSRQVGTAPGGEPISQLVVTLRQVGTLDAPQLVGTKAAESRPAAPHPLEPFMGQRMVPPLSAMSIGELRAMRSRLKGRKVVVGGGKRRDRALAPVIARLHERLVSAMEANGNVSLAKFDDSEPRDDAGRWSIREVPADETKSARSDAASLRPTDATDPLREQPDRLTERVTPFRADAHTGTASASSSTPLLKYSDDEPRDATGKWTDGGGDSAQGREFTDKAAAKAWAERQYDPWYQTLVREADTGQGLDHVHTALGALDHYSSFSYQVINGVQRGSVPTAIHYNPIFSIPDRPVTPDDITQAKRDIPNLSMAIERTPPLDEPTTVWRGMSADQIAGLKPGDTFTDKGFVSTALVPEMANPGVGEVPDQLLAEIHLPAGIHAAPTPEVDFGTELVLQAGTTFRVDAVKPSTDPGKLSGWLDLSIVKPGDLVLSGNVGKAADTDHLGIQTTLLAGMHPALRAERYRWTAEMIEVQPSVAKGGGSPLQFSAAALQALQDAYAEAYNDGFDDADPEGGAEPTDEGIQEAIDNASSKDLSNLLASLAALTVGGRVSEAMLLSRLRIYEASLYALYNLGFDDAVGRGGEVTQVEWVSLDDKGTCEDCADLDGQTWIKEESHPFPGASPFGGPIRCGPNCRCELHYTLLEELPGEDDYLGDYLSQDEEQAAHEYDAAAVPDLTILSVDELRALRVLAAKYDESEPRDEAGKWTDGGGTWTDPGEEPKVWGRADLTYEQKRDLDDAWNHAMARGVAMGKIDPAAAQQRGWSASTEHGIAPLPPVLYHATVAADAVLANGLKTQDELYAAGLQAKGLGGGSSDTISLTTDRAYAERIAQVIVESHDVATGAITEQDLIDRAAAGGFLDGDRGMIRSYETTMGRGSYEVTARGETIERGGMTWRTQDEVPDGWHPDASSGSINNAAGVPRYNTWDRPMTAEEAQAARFDLYRAFTFAQSVNGGPTDPMLWAPDPKYYANLDPAQVAVVQVTPIPGAMGYFVSEAEAEWRTWSGDAVTVSALKFARSGIVKYSEAEPRDDHGRWTGDGGGEEDPEEYRIAHRAPGPDNGAPMHDLGRMFPADVYDRRVNRQYYGTGDDVADRESFAAIAAAQGKPDAPIRVYRAVPRDVGVVNPGDWVTPSPTYAEAHGAGRIEDGGHVISITVPASTLWWNGDSINEFGYVPPVGKMATADLVALWTALKYSEDEPRDEQGRWTAGDVAEAVPNASEWATYAAGGPTGRDQKWATLAGDRPKLDAALRDIRGGERAVVQGPDGKFLWTKDQKGNAVDFTNAEMATMNGGTLTHNHPDGWNYPVDDPRHAGNPFSGDDIRCAMEAHMAEMRAVTPTGTYSLRPPADGWPTWDEVRPAYEKAMADVRQEFTARLWQPEGPIPGYESWGDTPTERAAHASADHFVEVNTRLANQFGWSFTFEPAS